MKFGAHVSIAGGVFNAPQNGKEATCDVVQIFTKNQMQWRVPELSDADVEKFIDQEKKTGVRVVSVHASYLINLGGFEPKKLQQSRMNFLVEMRRAERLSIPYLVVHPGSHVGRGMQVGLERIAESLDWALEKSLPNMNLKILLEITAGQGDNLGFTFEQLAEIQSRVQRPEKVGICLDTCHLFAAGYELRTKQGYSETMRQLDEIIGSDQVGVLHCNDSKRELGSRVDRHAHIGEGELGLEAFACLVNDERFREVPKIIETPGGPEKDAENLEKLRGLVAADLQKTEDRKSC